VSASASEVGRQLAIPVTLMRGGTSKGVFVNRAEFPSWDDAAARDAMILRLMGTPDPMQIDGLGGTHSSTSKVVVVGPGREPGVDLEYTFVQVGVDAAVVDYRGNCGNLTAAVAPFALHEGLVKGVEPVTTLTLWNTNTQKRIVAEVPFRDGRVLERGDEHIDGVPGTGAAIVTQYLDPAGTSTGRLFPTGRARDTIETSRGVVEVSIVDVTNPFVFVRAVDLGLDGRELPGQLNGDARLLQHIDEIRSKAGVLAGLHADEAAAARSNIPVFAFVSAPREAQDIDLVVRVVSMKRIHHACAGTGAMCTSAAARLAGTIPHELAVARDPARVVLGHPKGTVTTDVVIGRPGAGELAVARVSLVRTARQLMRGHAFIYF
jgi:2-methylaconitate cis-trans-isomerase PrpF